MRSKLKKLFRKKLKFNQTPAEKKFKEFLLEHKIQFVFQKPFTRFHSFGFMDFFIKNSNLCIEIDGGYHNNPIQREKDAKRQKDIEKKGILVIRFTNEEILNNKIDLSNVKETILERWIPDKQLFKERRRKRTLNRLIQQQKKDMKHPVGYRIPTCSFKQKPVRARITVCDKSK